MIGSTFSSSDYVYPTVLPWKQIIDDIKEAGLSRKKIADLIGRPWTTVQRWHLDGVEPPHSDATAILLLHSRYCGNRVMRSWRGDSQTSL